MKGEDIRSVVRDVIAETFHLPKEKLASNLNIEIVAEWDSIGHLNLLANVEQKLDWRCPVNKVHELWSEDAIVAAIIASNAGGNQ